MAPDLSNSKKQYYERLLGKQIIKLFATDNPDIVGVLLSAHTAAFINAETNMIVQPEAAYVPDQPKEHVEIAQIEQPKAKKPRKRSVATK